VTSDSAQDLTAQFTETMRLWAARIAGPKIGLAVSGGGDSMALLTLMHVWAQNNDRQLFVATVDHGLREESGAETKMVQAVCQKMGVECTILKWTDWDKTGNLQDAARDARNRLIGAWAEELELDGVATGHTADDQAETFLLRLARGSGVDGLSGMSALRVKQGMPWFRPLLTYRRADLRSFLKSKRIKWVDDPSNEDQRYDRIKLRKAQKALDGLGLTVDRLVETATRMSTARRALERLTKEHAQNVVTPTNLGTVKIDIEAFKLLPLELRYRLFSHVLKWVSGSIYRPRFDALLESASRLSAGTDHTLLGCHIISDGISAEVCREVSKIKKTKDFSQTFDGRWVITADGPNKGLSLGPLGEKGLPQCEGWRDLGASRISLLGSPAIWKGTTLIAAPLAGLSEGWQCQLEKDHHEFFTSIVTH
jgi:tRNA(Ile)-lysidine synthase